MHSLSAKQGLSGVRPRLRLMGLTTDESQLVERAAIGEWHVVRTDFKSTWSAEVNREYVTVTVAALHRLEALGTQSSPLLPLTRWSGVALIPTETEAERQQWLARHAPSARIVVTGLPNSLRTLRHALHRVRHDAVATALAMRVDTLRTPQAARVLQAALFLESSSACVPAVAHALHMHERTLRKKLLQAGVTATPQRLLGWARLLHAAWYLRDASIPVERVAGWLCFSAASNLHRMLRSYAKLSVSELRRQDEPIAFVVEELRAELTAGSPMGE